jgi:hypothetical protein
MTLTTTQGIIKQVAEEGVKRVQTPVTAEIVEFFCRRNSRSRKRIKKKVTFEVFMAHWKHA